jgi:hypothetical protein
VIHGLFEARVALLEHLSVNVDDVYARGRGCAGQCPSPTRDVDAQDGLVCVRSQERDEGVFPEAVHTERHGVVHDEYASYECLFGFFGDGAETEVRCGCGVGGR